MSIDVVNFSHVSAAKITTEVGISPTLRLSLNMDAA